MSAHRRARAPGPAGRRADAARMSSSGRSFKAAMAAVRRLRGRESQRPGELSYAQYSLLFGLATEAGAVRPAGSPRWPS